MDEEVHAVFFCNPELGKFNSAGMSFRPAIHSWSSLERRAQKFFLRFNMHKDFRDLSQSLNHANNKRVAVFQFLHKTEKAGTVCRGFSNPFIPNRVLYPVLNGVCSLEHYRALSFRS